MTLYMYILNYHLVSKSYIVLFHSVLTDLLFFLLSLSPPSLPPSPPFLQLLEEKGALDSLSAALTLLSHVDERKRSSDHE